MQDKDLGVIVLAGGKGKRMGSSGSKVLCSVAGKPLILWILELLNRLNLTNIVVVTGYEAGLVEKIIVEQSGIKPVFVRQAKPRGTADAVNQGLKGFSKRLKTVLVIFGDDSSLYSPRTILELLDFHNRGRQKMTVLSTLGKPLLVGALRRDGEGNLTGVLRYQDLIKAGTKKAEAACGVFCFEIDWLKSSLPKIEKNSKSGEYSLPALIKIAAEEKDYARTFKLVDSKEWHSFNTPEDWKTVSKMKLEALQRKI